MSEIQPEVTGAGLAQDIVYLSRVPWDGLYQRPQHLAAGLARTHRVLYVDPPRSTFYRRFIKPLFAHRPVRPFLWQPTTNLTVLSPGFVPFLPKWWPPPGQYWLSRQFLRWAIRRLGIASPILWLQDPRDLYFRGPVAPTRLCYDCMDDYALIAPTTRGRTRLRRLEQTLLQQADLVLASSQELANRCRLNNDHVVLVPNGVDADAFSPAGPIAPDVAAIPGPRLGYVGALAPWLDFPLLANIARAHPEWSLVLVGPVVNGRTRQLDVLRRLTNVHILGERPYQQVAAYMRGFDVCLIPFHINGITRVVNPVKFYEYIAVGKPVIASYLPELAAYAHVCSFADSTQTWIEAIGAALVLRDDPQAIERRLTVARANTWAQRVAAVAAALAECQG